MTLAIAIVVILGMIGACYFTSGISFSAGTIFERKSVVVKSSKK